MARNPLVVISLMALGACALVRGGGDERSQIDVRAEDAALGPATAPVRVVFFGDFQ